LLTDKSIFFKQFPNYPSKIKNIDAFDKKCANNIILKNHYPPANRMQSNNLGLPACTVHYFWNITAAAAFVIGIEKLNMSLNKE